MGLHILGGQMMLLLVCPIVVLSNHVNNLDFKIWCDFN